MARSMAVYRIVIAEPKLLSANTLDANRGWRRGDSRSEARLRRVKPLKQMLRICGVLIPIFKEANPVEAGGFEPPSGHFRKSLYVKDLQLKRFSNNRLNHSQILSHFIRIYQNLAFKYSRITPANHTLETTCKCIIIR
jgi:hypothetical protein